MERLPVSEIVVGKRHRQNLGDLSRLARSMQQHGLLQPIGVTKDNQLIFGERRLKAAKELGWATIMAVRIDFDAIVEGEFEENDNRLNFSPSERVAIGQSIEVLLAGRRGKPSQNVKVENFPPLGKTRDIAAKKAGFGNPKTYEQAKTVVNDAEPEVKEAMDSGAVAISDAASIAKEPPGVQREAVKAVAKGKSKTLKEAAEKITHDPIDNHAIDALKLPVPDSLKPVFVAVAKFNEAAKHLNDALAIVEALGKEKAGAYLRVQEIQVSIRNAKEAIRFAKPYTTCPYCKAESKTKCDACKGRGFVPKPVYENAPKEMKCA